MNPDIKKGLRNCGIFLVAFTLVVVTGIYAPILLFVVCPVVCAAAGVLITKNMGGIYYWGVLGLIAGAGFYFAI